MESPRKKPDAKWLFAADNNQAIQYLQAYLKADDVVLVKGSRGMKMEQIVQNLMG